MAEIIKAQLDAGEHRFAVVVSRFSEFITDKLAGGAVDMLERHGARPEQITQVWVPGAWELPLAVQKLADSGRYAAVIALGCVIRGATPHFEYVAGEACKGVAQAMLKSGVPVAFGILTTDTLEQAIERAGSKAGNKGAAAALAALEMANLMSGLSQ